jgi:hypothetical protein
MVVVVAVGAGVLAGSLYDEPEPGDWPRFKLLPVTVLQVAVDLLWNM